ncbi:hypothetical protein CJF30_00002463 [Rutstroemia sp. NJR-2017a BBW]|nr:hypothetical protein CJF30_00002463 [Rutstroemia sp. NJR-2017a BBW]
MTAVRAILQGILALRLIAGGILVGLTRPEFAPSCVAKTSVLPTAIVVLVLDIIIVGFLLVQASSLGMFGDRRESHRAQSKALLFIIAGFAIWTALSVPMFLGMASIILLVKTVAPANGLLILIGIITIFPNALMLQKGEDPVTADARSPFSSPLPQSRNIIQNPIGADGDITVEKVYSKYGAADPGKTTVRSVTRPIYASDAGIQASSDVFPSIFAASSQALAPGTQTPGWPQDAPSSAKRSVFAQSKAQSKSSIRGLAISKPMMNPDADSAERPFARIATIDLQTAALNDRERRAIASKKSPFTTPRAVPLPPSMSPEDLMKKNAFLGRKRLQSQTSDNLHVTALSTSASLSPGREEVRRRSPLTENRADNSNQRNIRPMTGLPSNPRARGNAAPFQSTMPAPQMVMFMKDIIYNDPAMVESIIKERPAQYESVFSISDETSYTTELKSSASVIHRPRPIPRFNSNGMFASETANEHRRTKSGSSIISRKSFFASNPGSPTQLPPLPKPPPVYSAANLTRLLPNDTKTPPGISSINNRRSSVPSLPRVPSVFLSETPARSPTELSQQEKRSSKRSTIAILRSQDEPTNHSVKDGKQKHDTIRSSTTLVQSHSSADTSILHIGLEQSMQVSGERRGVQNSSAPDDYEGYADLSERSDFNFGRQLSENQPDHQQEEEYGDGDEVMVVMMDSAEHRQSMLDTTSQSRESFLPDVTILADQLVHPKSWHRRIGDDLPSFSDRKSKHVSRRLSPPTPLLLDSRRGGRQTMIILTAEPSPPLDSPTKALEEIHVQLSRLEVSNRESLGAMLRKMPDVTNDLGSLGAENSMERLRLLENLEKEMGEQENDWQKLQRNFCRDSLSSMGTPRSQIPPGEPDNDVSRRSSLGISQSPPRNTSRRAKGRDSLAEMTNAATTWMPESIPENPRVSIWQRLAKAQKSYEENAPELSRRPSLNFLSIAAARKPQLGSPTPPESEDEDELEAPILYDPVLSGRAGRSLWQPSQMSQNSLAGQLWQPSIVTKTVPESPETPARDLRPKRSQRIMGFWFVKVIERQSSASDPEAAEEAKTDDPTGRHWCFPWGERSDTAVPQYTLNTPQPAGPVFNAALSAGSRQVASGLDEYSSSFFDDYDDEDELDNEVMDSESEDEFDETTLWEIATLLQSTNIPSKNSLLPPRMDLEETMSNYEEEDGSISYFDSEEEEDLDNNGEPVMEATAASYFELDKYDDEDEEFDFEEAKESIIIFSQDDGLYHVEEDHAAESSDMVAMTTKTTLPANPVGFEDNNIRVPENRSLLWRNKSGLVDSKSSFGLPQPENNIWQFYTFLSFDNIPARKPSKAFLSGSQPPLLTNELWSVRVAEDIPEKSMTTWMTHSKTKLSSVMTTAMTWTPDQASEEEHHQGLFSLEAKRRDFRSTSSLPAAIDTRRPPRKVLSDLPKLSSQKLWSVEVSSVPENNGWIWATQAKVELPIHNSPRGHGLWKPNAIIPASGARSLYAGWAPQSASRRCELEPAALDMRLKQRIANTSQTVLESSQLWSSVKVCTENHDWISESSIRPKSPSIYSTSSSGRSSPDILDALSIISTSTKASSLQLTSINSAQGTPSAKKRDATGPTDPTKYTMAAPTRLLSLKPSTPIEDPRIPTLPSSVRQSRVLASRSIFEDNATASQGSAPMRKFRPSASSDKTAKASHRSIRHQYRPALAFRANWDDALAEAILAGSPKPAGTSENWDLALAEAVEAGAQTVVEVQHGTRSEISRPTATMADWNIALGKAISAGRPRMQRPVTFSFMWEDALKEAIAAGTTGTISEPAKHLESIIKSDQRYDAAVLHPVFFTTSMVSITADIHPACIGHVRLTISQPSSQPRLWSQKLTKVGKYTATGLWPATATPSSQFVTSPEFQQSSTSRRSPKCSSRLPVLVSFKLWQSVPMQSVSRDWLRSSSQSLDGIFPLFRRQTPPLKSNLRKSMMWAAGSAVLADIPDLFADVDSVLGPVKRFSSVRKTGLEKLESRALFGILSKGSERKEVDWLRKSSVPFAEEKVIEELSIEKLVSQDRSSNTTKLSPPTSLEDNLAEEETHDLIDQFMAEPLPVSQLWTSRPRKNVIENTTTWTHVQKLPASIPNMFAKEFKAYSSGRPRVLPAALEKLESTELFLPISRPKTSINWLIVSSKSSHSQQHLVPATRLESWSQHTKMWTPSSSLALKANDDGLWSLVTSPKHDEDKAACDIYAGPIIRKTRKDSQLKEIATAELWSKKHTQEDSRHWLLE